MGAAVPRAAAHRRGPRAAPPSWARAHPQLLELTDKIAAGIAVEGMESLAPVLVDEMELLVDLMPDDTHVLVLDPERARSRAHDLVATSEEFLGASWAAAAGGGTAPIDLGAASYRALADVREHSLAQDKPWWTMSPFGIDDADGRRRCADALGEVVSVDVDVLVGGVPAGRCRRSPPRPTAATSTARIGDIERWLGRGPPRGRACTPATARRSGWSRCSASTTCPPGSSTTPTPPATSTTHVVTVTCGALVHGFVDEANRLVLLTGEDLSGPEGLDPRHAQDAGAAQAADRPARARRPATTSSTSSTASAASSR